MTWSINTEQTMSIELLMIFFIISLLTFFITISQYSVNGVYCVVSSSLTLPCQQESIHMHTATLQVYSITAELVRALAVVKDTLQVNRNSQFLGGPPPRKLSGAIKVKSGTNDYVEEGNLHAKFGNIPITGGFSPYRWNITFRTSANNFLRNANIWTWLQMRPLKRCQRAISQIAYFRGKSVPLGVKTIIFNFRGPESSRTPQNWPKLVFRSQIRQVVK